MHVAITKDRAKAHPVVGEVCVRDIGSGLELLTDPIQVPLLDGAAFQLHRHCPVSLPAVGPHEYKKVTAFLSGWREFIASIHSCKAALAPCAGQTEVTRLVTARIGQALRWQPFPDTFDPVCQFSILLQTADDRCPLVVQLLSNFRVAGIVHPCV